MNEPAPSSTQPAARPSRPTWIEVDLDAIANNVRCVADLVGPRVAVLAVLKGNAYGHGAPAVARTALASGAARLGVACLGEALTLRREGISAPILVLGFTPPWQAGEALENDVTLTVFSRDVAEALSEAGVRMGREARAHVKVDTGMGRLGVLPDEALPFMRAVTRLPALRVEGLYTHMASADVCDLAYTHDQLARFAKVVAMLRAEGLLPEIVHAANSAATLRLPESHYDMVRIGIAMYGLNPAPEAPCPPQFRPALSLKCLVAQVKELPTGSYIGYGCTFCTARPSRIAALPIGYADGFRRAPVNWGEALVRGRRAPIVGRVCMDQAMIDVTDIPDVRAGDEVVLIGAQGSERITVDDVAARLGTINYEVVAGLLPRVPRVHIGATR